MTRPTRSSIVLGALLVVAVLQLYTMTTAFKVSEGIRARSFLATVLFYDWAILELMIVALLARLITAATHFSLRFTGYVALTLIGLVYLGQSISLLIGGEFLSRLTLENVVHIDFISGTMTPFIIPVLALLLGLAWFSVDRLTKPERLMHGVRPIVFGMIGLGILAWKADQFIPLQIRSVRNAMFGKFGVSHTAPLIGFGMLFLKPSGADGQLTQEDVETLARRQIMISPGARYPLVRSSAYSPANVQNSLGVEFPDRPNVVLLFSEGISARSLEVYSKRYPGLTPNLSAFAEKAVVFDNYWNHTAASYRGMKGQLCSIYPARDGTDVKKGINVRYHCLPDIFREAGYRTIFLNAHNGRDSYLDEMMPALGFDKIVNAEHLIENYLPGARAEGVSGMTDRQFFKAFGEELQKQTLESHGSPVFVSAYNRGTHAFLDIGPAELKWGDGSNNALNTIHNFDHAFGEFWRRFDKTPAAANTVLIITSDHAHYPEPTFVRAFEDETYARLFFDRVPLMIYTAKNTKQVRYDARNASSIDLAPTIAHLLALPNGPNPWLGVSMFDRNRIAISSSGALDSGVVGYLDRIFIVGDHPPKAASDPNDTNLERRAVRRFFDFIMRLEALDRIWDPDIRKQRRRTKQEEVGNHVEK